MPKIERMDTQLDPNTIIDRLGGTSETARICEVKPPSVSEWRHKGIPRTQLKFLRAARPEVFTADWEPAEREATEPSGSSTPQNN
jgi:hypothetical protein